MPDVSMCSNVGCKQKDKCYRYMARPSNWQSYSHFARSKDQCDYFTPIEERDELSTLEEANQRSARFIVGSANLSTKGN